MSLLGKGWFKKVIKLIKLLVQFNKREKACMLLILKIYNYCKDDIHYQGIPYADFL